MIHLAPQASAVIDLAMTQPKANLKRVIVLLTLLLTVLWADSIGVQQSKAQDEPGGKFLNTKVPEFELHNQTLLDGLWNLARIPVPDGWERKLARYLLRLLDRLPHHGGKRRDSNVDVWLDSAPAFQLGRVQMFINHDRWLLK
jgi:hypothetical protein